MWEWYWDGGRMSSVLEDGDDDDDDDDDDDEIMIVAVCEWIKEALITHYVT